MLQNRVDPFGTIIKTSARGTLMGNRGVIHNHRQEIKQSFKHKAWITCVLEFKERRRPVMAPNQYTELFFLDEATAFAAGHRPCSECRKADFKKFKSCWIQGNPEYGFDMKTSIQEIDAVLHLERIAPDKSKVTFLAASPLGIPDGCFIVVNDYPMAVCQGLMYAWTPFGYEKGIPIPEDTALTVLTPKSMVNAFQAGYAPRMNC